MSNTSNRKLIFYATWAKGVSLGLTPQSSLQMSAFYTLVALDLLFRLALPVPIRSKGRTERGSKEDSRRCRAWGRCTLPVPFLSKVHRALLPQYQHLINRNAASTRNDLGPGGTGRCPLGLLVSPWHPTV